MVPIAHANEMHTCGNNNCKFMFFPENILVNGRRRKKSVGSMYVCANRLDLLTEIQLSCRNSLYILPL